MSRFIPVLAIIGLIALCFALGLASNPTPPAFGGF